MNAAVWFGAAVFCALGIEAALTSPEMLALIQSKNFLYFSVAIEQILSTRASHWFVACGVVAIVHLAAERLYLGKSPRRFWLALVLGLCLGGLAQAFVVQPKLKESHRAQYRPPVVGESAGPGFRRWTLIAGALQTGLIAGLAFYLWGVAHPPDTTRPLRAPKFRIDKP